MNLLLGFDTIEAAWRTVGRFVPYPDVLSIALNQGMFSDKSGDALLKELFSKVIQYDRKTGLRKGYLTENIALIRHYQLLCERDLSLACHKFLRVWGDFSNMGGLTNALSLLESEAAVGNGRSLEGIQRAGNYIAAVSAQAYEELTKVNNKGVYLYREGGDEIGGIIILDQQTDTRLVSNAISNIMAFSAGLSITAGVAHIEHRKRKLVPELSGTRLLAGFFELNQYCNLNVEMSALEASFEGIRPYWPVEHTKSTPVASLTREQVAVYDQIISNAWQSMSRPYAPASIFSALSFAKEAQTPDAIFKATNDAARECGFSEMQRDTLHTLVNIAYKDPNTEYWRAELLYSSILAAAKETNKNSYLLLAQQLNFLGINQTLGHTFCDSLFQDVAAGALASLNALQTCNKFVINEFEPSDNILPTANKLAFLIQNADQESVREIIQTLHYFSETKNLQSDLRSLRHPLKGYYGAPLSFAVTPLPKMTNDFEAEKTLAMLFKEINDNENSGIIFDSKNFDQSSGNKANRITLKVHKNPS